MAEPQVRGELDEVLGGGEEKERRQGLEKGQAMIMKDILNIIVGCYSR